MSDLIDKIAREIAKEFCFYKYSDTWNPDDFADGYWREYVGSAKAAIAILAKPENITDEMASSAKHARIWNKTVRGEDENGNAFDDLGVWRKAIAASISSILNQKG